MEKKKKKKGSTNSQEISKEDQNQTGTAKNTCGSSSHDNAPPPNHQFQPVFQCPNTAQSEMEKSPLTSKPCIPNLSASPVIPSRWHQAQHFRPNPTIHQAQYSQPLPHLAQQSMPFWMAQQHSYQLPGANEPAAYQQYTPVGTTDVTWQGPGMTNGDVSPRSLVQAPSFSYHVGYPYQGFPGTMR